MQLILVLYLFFGSKTGAQHLNILWCGKRCCKTRSLYRGQPSTNMLWRSLTITILTKFKVRGPWVGNLAHDIGACVHKKTRQQMRAIQHLNLKVMHERPCHRVRMTITVEIYFWNVYGGYLCMHWQSLSCSDVLTAQHYHWYAAIRDAPSQTDGSYSWVDYMLQQATNAATCAVGTTSVVSVCQKLMLHDVKK